MNATMIAKITRTSDYKRMKEMAHKIHGRFILMLVAANVSVQGVSSAQTMTENPLPARFGITVTKALGNAVKRNKVKRRLRCLLRQYMPQYGIQGYDYICIARHKAASCSYQELETDLHNILHKAKHHAHAASSPA